MTDLSNLPEDLQHVIKLADCDFSADYAFTPVELRDYTILRDYILRVTAERDELQGANEYHRLALVSAQKQIAELAAERDAMAKRIADAPVGVVELCYNGHAPAFMGFAKPLECGTCADIANQRVALLKVE